MQAALDTIVERSADLLSVEAEGETLFMCLGNGNYYRVNKVGTELWEALARPAAVGALVDALCAKFDVERGRCTADVLALLDAMQGQGLVAFR